MKLIVGLGNPGREYVGTRHNIGWAVVEALATRLGWTSKPAEFDRVARSNFEGLTLDGTMSLHATGGTEKLLLLKPTTYMNLSGRAVQAALGFYQATPDDLMVVLDHCLYLATGPAIGSARILVRTPAVPGAGLHIAIPARRAMRTPRIPARAAISAKPAASAARNARTSLCRASRARASTSSRLAMRTR